MRAYERSGSFVKHTALLFIIMMMLMKGCAGCVETERMGLLQLKSHLKNLYNVTEESFLDSWSHNDSKSDCCLWERVKCSDTIGGHIVYLTLEYIMPRPFNLTLDDTGKDSYWDVPRPLNLSLFHSFPQLKTLDLSRNYFTDLFDPIHGVVFPSSLLVLNLRRNQLSLTHEGYSEICRLRHLRELDLSSNALTNLPYCLGNLSHLRTLDLSNNQLNGNLSSFVSDLPSALEYLSLLDNNFNGLFFFKSLVNQTRLAVFILSSKVGMIQSQTENSWFPLFQLKILKLQNFSFGSTVPGFLVHQHDLFFIDISHNKLKGAFPTWLVQNNTRLEILLLHSNSLTKLRLPRLVHGLQVLDISRNRIYGTIQEDVGIVFPKLRYMDFASNHFHGTIPSSMGEMKSLFFLDMSSNDLYGQLPKIFLSGCYSLSVLKLSNNQFHGKIFPEHVNLTDLVFLFLDGNNFNGSLEKGLLKLKKLDLLDISNNRFSGILPLWIGRMSLGTLDVSGNQLKGPFPVQLQNLYFIDISHNSFSGSIPRNVNFSFLTELRLHNNEFMGSIPDTLLKSPKLEVLDLRNNNLSGNIPDTIGNASVLGALLLRNNSLQSHTLERICQLSKVNLLDLSHNKFKGVIPSCLGNMSFGRESNDGWFPGFSYELGIGASSFLQNWSYTSALSLDYDDLRHVFRWNPEPTVDFLTKSRYESYQGDILSYMYGLDLSNNQISGDIPTEIGDLENIRSLNLSGNHLTGSIPNSFSKLKDLGSLDLSNNKLDGNIPPMLADLNSLGYFNVSCNNLSGEIPSKGHLLTFGTMSYIGNAHLCGRPTNKSCNPTGVLEPSASKQAKEEEEDDDVIDMVWFYWTCGAVYISTFLALFLFLCIDSHWSRKWDYGVDLFIYHLQRFKGGFFSS
ncbi:Receptor-like protein 1 [Cardamine amara subsp. amara]|uniref:Receptor-like protein 1 n=1 Tax=Cardamine amara subsp. amara TaxID=228776 RepID=A0ABD0Z8D6_CARAN